MTSRVQMIIPTAIVIFVIVAGVSLAYFQGRTGLESGLFDRCHGYGALVARGGETMLTEQSAVDLARTYGVAYAPDDVVPIAVCQPHEYSGLARVHADIGLLVGPQPAADNDAIARRQAAEPGWVPPASPDYDAIYQQRFVRSEVRAITDGCDSGWTTLTLEALGVEACFPSGWILAVDTEDYALVRSGGVDVGIFAESIVAFAAGCASPEAIGTPGGQVEVCQSRPTLQYRTVYGLTLPRDRSVSVRIAADATADEEAVALRVAAAVTELP